MAINWENKENQLVLLAKGLLCPFSEIKSTYLAPFDTTQVLPNRDTQVHWSRRSSKFFLTSSPRERCYLWWGVGSCKYQCSCHQEPLRFLSAKRCFISKELMVTERHLSSFPLGGYSWKWNNPGSWYGIQHGAVS